MDLRAPSFLLAAAQRGQADVWPRTSRPLPWLLAGFLALLFLVPINGIELDIPLPVDPQLDRCVLAVIFGIWFLVASLGARPDRREKRPALVLGATVLFFSVALVSIVLNAGDISRQGLIGLAQNQVALLIGFVLFAFFAAASVRPGELRNFSILLVTLASITAVGVMLERRTGFNVFYGIGMAFDPIATVPDPPTEINPDPTIDDRKVIVGPTDHGLAVTAMLVMAVPFAVVGFFQTRSNTRWLYFFAIALLVGAALSTERKTAVVAPVAGLMVIAAYRPKAVIRVAPLGVVMVAFIYAAAPGALGTIYELEGIFSSDSSAGRSDDYDAVLPNFLAHPLFGAGYGTRDISDVNSVRILDNEYLGELLTVGLFGVAAFFAMILAAIVVAHPVIRAGNPSRAGPALAASAGCTIFLVISLLFDSMSFPQAPHVFFFVAALATVAAGHEVHERAQARVGVPAVPAPT